MKKFTEEDIKMFFVNTPQITFEVTESCNLNCTFVFLDEATNSLDANNERAITENLVDFYEGRTVVVAHHLSTVSNADQIVVLDEGKIVEVGTHEELTALRGKYFALVKNQLELGS